MRPILTALLALFLAVPAVATESEKPKPSVDNFDVRIEGQIGGETYFNVGSSLDDAKKAGAKHLTIYLNTPGGEVYPGMLIIRLIKNTKIPTTCVVEDMALSMGAIILESSACGERVAQAQSMIMFHGVQSGAEGSQQQVESRVSMMRVLNYFSAALVAPRLGLTIDEYLKRIEGKEWWLAGPEVLAQHVVDRLDPTPEPAK